MVSPGDSSRPPPLDQQQQQPERRVARSLDRRRIYPAAFAKYRFYLDIRSARVKATLVEDILALGGGVEEFLGKDATHVISDSPEWKFTAASNGGGTPGPPSPWTPTATPSPATPASIEYGERGPKKPKSRVDCIVAAARAPARNGTSDVLEVARRLNCNIWALHKTLEWLAKFKSKYVHIKAGNASASASHSVHQHTNVAAPPVRELRAPFIKLESCLKLLRPLYAELKEYPELYIDGLSGASPFCGPSLKNRRKKLVKRLDLDRRAERPPAAVDRVETPPKAPAVAANAPPKKLCHKKKQGFCEICALSFSDLETHLVSDVHTKFVRTPSNWAKVESSGLYRAFHPMLL